MSFDYTPGDVTACCLLIGLLTRFWRSKRLPGVGKGASVYERRAAVESVVLARALKKAK